MTSNFYDEWLEYWDIAEGERAASRLALHDDERDWLTTRQDHRAALLIDRRVGFRTWGMTTMIAEVPKGGMTGRHKHGEEVIYFLEGRGLLMVNDVLYEVSEGDVAAIPFSATHQLFNVSDGVLSYLSVLSPELEHFAGVHKTEQLQERGFYSELPAWEAATSDLLPSGKRIVLRGVDAPPMVEAGQSDPRDEFPEFDADNPLVLGTFDGGMERLTRIHKSQVWNFMRMNSNMNEFEVFEQEITGILEDAPHTGGGKHAHMEAHLYVLQGEGYSVVDEVKVPWYAGSAVFIPGPQSVHQHFNTGDSPARMLRIVSGFRYFLEKPAQAEWPYLYLEAKANV